MESVGRKRKCRKNPQKLHFSKGLMIFDDFDICYGAANKVVKQD